MVGSGVVASQKFLDENQYTRKSIIKYERIFGHNWVSTGGEQTTKVSNGWYTGV